MGLLGAAQELERSFVDGTFARLAVEARDGFGVVIEDIGLGGQDYTERIPVAAKIGDQDFDFAARDPAADLFDGSREDVGAAIFLVVAVDRGHYRVSQAHSRHGFRDAIGFFLVWRAHRFARRDSAEPACPGTNVAQDHESGGAVLPALAHVWTAGALTDGVEVE